MDTVVAIGAQVVGAQSVNRDQNDGRRLRHARHGKRCRGGAQAPVYISSHVLLNTRPEGMWLRHSGPQELRRRPLPPVLFSLLLNLNLRLIQRSLFETGGG